MTRRSRLAAIAVGLWGLPGAASAWQETAIAAPAETASDVFGLSRSVELELKSPGQDPLRVVDESRADARLQGLATESYPAGSRSNARSAAKVTLLREDEAVIDVNLVASTKVRGWSQAKSIARASIAVTVPPEMRDVPSLLRLSADNPAGVALTVTGPDGSRIAPIDGKPGQYLLTATAEGSYLIKSAVTAEAGDLATAGPEAEVQSVNLTAALERGPILSAFPQVQYIYRGIETDHYRQVGSILYDGMLHCTATLVGAKTILTAAHCLAGYEAQIRQGRFKFAIGKRASAPDELFAITSGDYPRDRNSGYFYDPASHADDIALAYLQSSPGGSPLPLHGGTPGWTVFQSEQLLFVGYGFNGSEPDSAGVKRHASWTVGSVGPRKVSWQTTGASTCAFDSGGPAFRGSQLLLVAVTSMGAEDCTSGVNTRVDAFAGWLAGKVR